MSRSVVGYIRQYLNNSASASPTGAVEAVTNLPIATGVNPGVFAEFSDAEALQYSNQGVIAVNILTAGSGQTNGTYTATASAGGAVIQYVVAGGAVTSVTVLTAGGPYTDAAIPTFTIAAGGTPGTVQAVIGVLYSGVYTRVLLDPAVTGTVAPGTALFWLQSAGSYPTVTTVDSGNNPDFAGVSIDPNFGAALPYAYIQQNGKARCLFASSGTVPTTFGDAVQITSASTNTFNATAAGNANVAITALYVGYALQAAPVSTSGLVRITRYPSRY